MMVVNDMQSGRLSGGRDLMGAETDALEERNAMLKD